MPENIKGGTFNISRAVWNHPVFTPSKFSEREAFLWMISAACWKRKTVRSGKIIVDLERGQLCFSVRFLAEKWGWSKSVGQRFLKKLEKRDMIWVDSGTGQNIITICNYNKYQLVPKSSGTDVGREAGQRRDSSGTKKNTVNTYNTVNIEAKASTKERTKRIPDDWVLSKKLGDWSLNEGYSYEHIKFEADKFRDYWIGVGGQKGRKLDWDATWRNWIRNSKGTQNAKQTHDPAIDNIARLAGLS